MRAKSRRVPAFLLTIFILCMGICFDLVKADSLPEHVFDTAGYGNSLSCDEQGFATQGVSLCACAEIEEIHLCTAEMLGVHRDATAWRATGRLMASGRQLPRACELANVPSFAMQPGRFSVGNKVLQVYPFYQEERVVQYIQNSDGKKRI